MYSFPICVQLVLPQGGAIGLRGAFLLERALERALTEEGAGLNLRRCWVSERLKLKPSRWPVLSDLSLRLLPQAVNSYP
jgi:hypothetical protein